MVNMEKSLMKNPFVIFIIPVIICTFLGYLSDNLMNGALTGISIGIGFVIGMNLFDKKQEKDERKESKKK
jgi:positive regulator of sigma E activity